MEECFMEFVEVLKLVSDKKLSMNALYVLQHITLNSNTLLKV